MTKSHEEIDEILKILRLPTIELTELSKDLEYLDKVAIEAMRGLQIEYNVDNFNDEQEYYKFMSKVSYNLAKAMLAEKKRVETELLGRGRE